jgi:integrase
LIKLYLQSAEFQALRPATRRPRVSMLEALAAEKGTVDIEDIDKAAIQASMNARRSKPHMANVWLTTVSNVFAWATRESLADPLSGEAKPILEENPAEVVKRLPIPKSPDPDEETGHPTFSDDDLARFETAYAEGTLERRAYAVFLYTGFRVGDAARVGRQHVQRDGTIKIRTERPEPTSRSASSRRSSGRWQPARTGARRCSTSSPPHAGRRGTRITSAGGSATGAARSGSTVRPTA